MAYSPTLDLPPIVSAYRPRRKYDKGNVDNTDSTAPATIAGTGTLVNAEVV